jgi:hypothetical protein
MYLTANGSTLTRVFGEAEFMKPFAEGCVLPVGSDLGDGIYIKGRTNRACCFVANEQTCSTPPTNTNSSRSGFG